MYCNPYCNPFGPRAYPRGVLRAFLWRQGAKEATLRAANRLSVLGLTFLTLAMIGAIFLITDVLFGGVVAAVATVATGAVFAWVWYGQPLLRLRD